ncbi:MAG: prephenate dehydrogenase [Aureliella sp.]
MAQYEHVVIVGVGLLGGSIGMALRQRGLAENVVGVGRNAERLSLAVELGAVDSYSLDLVQACGQADLAVVCTPVQNVGQSVLDCLRNMHGGIVTDVGSTKATICQQVAEDDVLSSARFVGSHPLAGSEKVGVEHSDADLFTGRTCVVTPTEATSPSDTDRVRSLWQQLGSQVIEMDPQLHDAAIARTSHLPHVVSSALAAATPSSVLQLAASGWLDTTRIAAGSPDLWQQIISENTEPVTEALKEYAAQLQSWIDAIESRDSAKIQALLELGKQQRDSVGN